ncbi:MAG: IPT/TIG domain-containing protein [Desulfuromonadales bacterium]|nr:IPT/TIG domain-containing protein [Desulfuromonadales bacterium]
MPIRLLIMLLCLCIVVPVAALEITAVSPSTATPGASITLSGGPFAAGDLVLVGDRRVAASTLAATRLTFTLPATLPAGDYILSVERDGTRTPPTFMLRVVQPPPRITLLSPATLDSCTFAGARQITVSGQHFRPGAQLLFDNAALTIDKFADSEIVFTLPAVKPGLHHIQVVNPDNQRSLTHALFLSSTPEITAVQSGADNVVSYELIIQGGNFLADSRLTANGATVGKALGNISADGSVRESMRYVDCTTLIYTRRPFLREARELSLQVVNPGGEQSNVYQLTTP